MKLTSIFVISFLLIELFVERFNCEQLEEPYTFSLVEAEQDGRTGKLFPTQVLRGKLLVSSTDEEEAETESNPETKLERRGFSLAWLGRLCGSRKSKSRVKRTGSGRMSSPSASSSAPKTNEPPVQFKQEMSSSEVRRYGQQSGKMPSAAEQASMWRQLDAQQKKPNA